ncbi:hypothetical protein BEN30_05965 [Magnetovibrio blakemorei]|uniref:Tetratricopeptide repeat-like domain-containing protein n=2 Tax=Magnetovibrio blakemorei TaxID=28181 RepID=A0A1E5Q9T6_9PROT|nr:hypothetical protein BEN30_05965 [Magnetovibrio blakemorei]
MAFQDQRISDVQTFFGMIVGVLGIVIAVASIATFFTSRSKAKNQAEESARQWMQDHAPDVADKLEKTYIEPIEARLAEAEQKINSMVESVTDKHDRISQILEHAQDAIQKGDGAQISNSDKDALDEAAKATKVKPREQWTYTDWLIAATQAYFKGDFIEVAEASNRAAQSSDATQKQAAESLVAKGLALSLAGCPEEALATYDAVEARFGGAAELVLREQVAKAQGNRGFTHLTLAKKAGQTAQGVEQAQGLLMTALADVEAALGVQPDDPIQLGNKAYALFLLGRNAEAEAPLRRALELGGEEARKNELDDAKIHPLPQDDAFVALVNRIWDEVQVAKKAGGDA